MKQKRYWLWVGVLGAIISIPAVFFQQIDAINYIYLPAVLYNLSGPGMVIGSRPAVLVFLAFMTNGFIYGALIGWVGGKIKETRS